MSEEISYELYKWLSVYDVVPSNLRYKSNGNYELDTKTTQGMISGFLIAKLLISLSAEIGATINQPLISSVKSSTTPAARVYNWNILAQSFIKLNVNIPKPTQKQITTGNFSTLIRFLLDLHKKYNPKKIQKKEEESNEINFNKLQVLQSYSQTQNLLELIVMIISQSLDLTPKQSLSTLNQNAKYYAHMVVKGIKGSFDQIIIMIDTFIDQTAQIMFFCQKSPQKNTQFILDLVKPTLISRDIDVAKKGALLFMKIIDESLKYNSKNLVYQILCKEGSGFDFLYMALKRHPDLINDFTLFLFPLIKEAFHDFFEIHLKRTINNDQQYLKILLRLVEGLNSIPQSRTILKESGLLKIWLKNSQESFSSKKNKDQTMINQQTKILYLQLLCNLWKAYSLEIDQQYAQQLLIKGIQELKRNTRKEIYTIKIPALLRLFDFLHFLADGKNKVAPILYKKLIFLLIENHQHEEMREMILNNFKFMMQKYPMIPIEFLLEPLLKQLINSQGKTYILNTFDFQFMIELCKHPKMDASFGLSYLQYLSKLYIKNFIYARLIIRVIQILTSRFCEQETIVQFLKKNVDSTLNLYGILLNKKKLSRQESIMNKQKKSLAIQLLKHYIQLEHQELNEYILQKITGFYLLLIQSKKPPNKGLKYLIELYGDLDDICLQYKISQNRKYENQMPFQSQQTIRESLVSNRKPTPKSEAYHQFQYMKEKGIGYKITHKTSKTRGQELIQRRALKPTLQTLDQIERIKIKYRQQEDRKRDKSTKQLRLLQSRRDANSLQLLQRNLSLGYAKLAPLQMQQILFQFQSVKPQQLKNANQFHTLDELEQIDQTSTTVILKNYSKEIKSLFLKYALMSASSGKVGNENIPVMSFTEVIKMLKQKNVMLINKLIVSDLISSIHYSKRKQKNALSGIQQKEFNELLIKLTDYLIQNQKSTQQIPFGLRLERLLKTLLAAQNFYENRFRIKEDQKIVKLKEMLRNDQDTQIEIPQGYKKVRQNQVQMKYHMSDKIWGIKQKHTIGYELTDWLLNQCLGFHVMTPSIEINNSYNLIQVPKPIKPNIPKTQTDKRINYNPTEINNNIHQPGQLTPGKKIQKKKHDKPQRRSVSQRAINKTKTDPIVLQEEKIKVIKRQKYVEKLKNNLQRLKQQKAFKQLQERKKQQIQKEKERKKEQERRQYLQNNREKIKQHKQRQQSEQQRKQEQEKINKEKLKMDLKKKQEDLLEKHKEDIKKKAEKRNEKLKSLQHSRDKKNQQIQKLAKETISFKEDIQNQKLKMLQIKNSLDNGSLKQIVDQKYKQLTDLFNAYWNWDKKRIELNSIALMLRDFKITPQFILPKTIAETYKSISKGQPLDFASFTQCLAKCAYKSPKLQSVNQKSQQNQVDQQVLKRLFDKFRMEEEDYKQIVKSMKDHLE